jgi:hypothetical protein
VVGKDGRFHGSVAPVLGENMFPLGEGGV